MIVNVATVQIAGVVLALGAIVATPPKEGVMLLLPVRSGAPVATIAVAQGAAILSRGPVAGSIVVRGRLSDLARPLLAQGIVPLAAPDGSCGEASAR